MLKIDQPVKAKKLYRIPKVSKKRASENRQYLKVRKTFLAENPRCQARIIPGCGYNATEIHHKKGRIGELLTDTRYFLATCRACHDKIEASPEWSKKNGFSISRNGIRG